MTTASIVGMTTQELEAWTTTLSPEEAAERLGLQASTLANWRWRGSGPRYVRVGGRVRYQLVQIANWLDEHTRTSTSDLGPRTDPQSDPASVRERPTDSGPPVGDG